MKNLVTCSLLISCWMLSVLSYAQTGLHIPSMDTVDRAVLKFMDQWNLPGASVAIADNGKLIYARGFGFADVETETLVQPYSKFRMASISKPLTAAAIFKMIDNGQLTLDTKVFGLSGILNDQHYLDIIDNRYLDITIGHLLSHTAGHIRYGLNIDPMFSPTIIAAHFGTPPPASAEQIIEYMLSQSLDYAPGTQQAYSNFGYCILGEVIEEISGMSYDQYVKTQILEIADAHSYELAENLKSQRKQHEVSYYNTPGSPLVPSCYGTGNVPAQYGGFNITAMDAHGGWIASAADILKFALAVDGKLTRPDAISSASVAAMVTHPTAGMEFAHGWVKYPAGRYHTGLINGSSGFVDVRNNGFAVAVLFNSHSFNGTFFQNMLATVWNAVFASTSFPSHDLFESVTAIQDQTPADWNINVYPNPASGEVNIELSDNTGEVYVEIKNIYGQLVHAQLLDQSHELLNTGHLPGGTYYFHFKDAGRHVVKSIVIADK